MKGKEDSKKKRDTINGVTGCLVLLVPAIVLIVGIVCEIGILLSVCFAFISAFIVTAISLLFKSPYDKKTPSDYSQYTNETKATVTLLREKINNNELESTLTHAFMDRNNILLAWHGVGLEDGKKCVFYIINDAEHGCCMLSSEDGTLYFRVPTIILEKHVEGYYKYHDPKLVYTGVTVGGITTGGFHVEGGNYTAENYYTDKYFHYIVNTQKFIINKIYCNSKIWREAKSNDITKPFIYNKNQYIYLAHDLSAQTQSDLRVAADSGDLSIDGSLARQMMFAQVEVYLTRDECNEIKDWIYESLDRYSVAIETP